MDRLTELMKQRFKSVVLREGIANSNKIQTDRIKELSFYVNELSKTMDSDSECMDKLQKLVDEMNQGVLQMKESMQEIEELMNDLKKKQMSCRENKNETMFYVIYNRDSVLYEFDGI